jgi:hypothetical protein
MLILLLIAALAYAGLRLFHFVRDTLRSLPHSNQDWHWW